MDAKVFEERRKTTLARMNGGVMVVFSSPETTRNGDVTHAYRQDSDFYYLTGFEEPGAALVLATGDTPKFFLFVRPRDPERETWDGPRFGVDRARQEYQPTDVFPTGSLGAKLPELLKGHERAFFALGRSGEGDRQFISALKKARILVRRGGAAPTQVIDVAEVLHEMRRLKQPEEQAAMRRANEVAQRAHLKAMAFAAPGRFEYELQAVLEHEFAMGGSRRAAYESIVGSGPNATILHYVDNRRQLEDGDLVLIDAGCELDYYASDITRTFPANGKFTPEQRNIYEIVLEAQIASIEAVKPGATFGAIHSVALRVITQGLIDLGFIEGPVESALEDKRHSAFYMHRAGHYLGMDVHDVGRYHDKNAPRPFDPGVVVTVEPGLYIRADNEDVPAPYRGIGIRIEDDVLVTENGYENLTGSLAKTVEEIEKACTG